MIDNEADDEYELVQAEMDYPVRLDRLLGVINKLWNEEEWSNIVYGYDGFPGDVRVKTAGAIIREVEIKTGEWKQMIKEKLNRTENKTSPVNGNFVRDIVKYYSEKTVLVVACLETLGEPIIHAALINTLVNPDKRMRAIGADLIGRNRSSRHLAS